MEQGIDLFSSVHDKEPLAARMRPRNLDEYIGQEHIVGHGRLLRRAIAIDALSSVIFYGPPGSGKTTLARVIAGHTKSNFITLNAVLTGVQNIREAIAQAEQDRHLYSKKTILFVDEVHRWNKSQQDALLPWVENGTIILVGATTENPFFEVNKALVSRSRVFQLEPLSNEDLRKVAMQALSDKDRGYGKLKIDFAEGALEHIIQTANGDARSLLNALELAVETTEPNEQGTIYISQEVAEESIQKKVVLYDKDGDYHYDIISAFIKSLRGRDPDASMYWLSRMIRAGEDPDFIFRRMLISACEDTGLAAPNAISIVENCAAAFDRVGLPEGRYHLAHAALYLATCPKSNSSMAFFDALSCVEKEDEDVPNHLKDPSRDAKGFGHGEGYLYPHAYRDHWVAQQYLPTALRGRVFYTPSTQGYEATIRDEVLSRRELQIASYGEEFDETPVYWTKENLTFSTEDNATKKAYKKAQEHWEKRTFYGEADALMRLRDKIIQISSPLRHSRSVIFNSDDGLLLWHINRLSPEGVTCAVYNKAETRDIFKQYSSNIDCILQPQLVADCGNIAKNLHSFRNVSIHFDRIYFKPMFTTFESVKKLALEIKEAKEFFSSEHKILIISSVPYLTQRLGAILQDNELLHCEELFYTDKTNPYFNWQGHNVVEFFSHDFSNVSMENLSLPTKRKLDDNIIEAWFNANKSRYGAFVTNALGEKTALAIKDKLKAMAKSSLINWQKSWTIWCII